MDGLGKFEAYNISVLGYTRPGDGPRSPAVEIQTFEDIPGSVENLYFDEVQFNSAKLVWDAPKTPNGRITSIFSLFFCWNLLFFIFFPV